MGGGRGIFWLWTRLQDTSEGCEEKIVDVSASLVGGGRSKPRPYGRRANAELRNGGAVGYARDGRSRGGRGNPPFVRAGRRLYDRGMTAWKS
jgi:hypothetical protein